MKAFLYVAISAASIIATPAVLLADVKSDYKKCIGKLPASVREEGCSAVIAETTEKVWQEKAHNSRGHARMDLGRFNEAVADFSETIRLDPKIAGYYDNRQYAHRQAGELDEALSDAYAAVKLAPTYSFVWRARALVYMDMAQYPMAVSDLREAIRLNPTDAGLYVEFGKAVDAMGRTEEAVGFWSKALEIDHEQIEAYKFRGLAEQKLGRRDAALIDLEKYQLVHPNDVDIASTIAAMRDGRP